MKKPKISVKEKNRRLKQSNDIVEKYTPEGSIFLKKINKNSYQLL